MLTRATARGRSVVAALSFFAAFAALAPQARAQSLADVAKKEEERRKSVPAPAKVYTNKDLNAVPAGSPPAARPADGAAKAADTDPKTTAAKTPDAAEKGSVRDQAYWAGKLKALQDALLRDGNYADAMQTRINSLTADFANRDDPVQRAVIGRDREKSLAELARLTKSVQDTRKAIADLQEEARRAGVPAAWMR